MRLLAVGRALRRRLWTLGWGFVDQAASSVTNLLLTIAAARVLGANSFGVVVIGFTAYVLLLGLHRGLISQPLVVSTAAVPADERRHVSRSAFTVTLVGGVAIAAAMTGIGIAIGGTAGHALLLFAPWMPAVLLQDLWRATLFRDSRGGAAAWNDLLWLAVMMPTLVGAWAVGTDWAIVAAWGLGASAGAVAGVAQMRLWPMSVAKALNVWRSDLWPFGRWLFGSGIVNTAGSQTSVFVIGALLGTAAVGGLRAVQTVFAPLTLLSPAIALPALPTMTRKLATAVSEAKTFALQLAGIVVVLTTVYVVLVGVLGADLLNIVFGRSFVVYENLILPVAVQQVIAAAGVGFDLLLRAGMRGRAVFGITAATGLLLVSLVAVSAWAGDLLTVAWSTAVVSGVSLVMLGAVAFSRAPELSVPEVSVRG